MNVHLLVSKIPEIMGEKSISMKTDFRQTARIINGERSSIYRADVKKIVINKVNLLECLLKELAYFKTNDEDVLKEESIISVINKYFNAETSLIRVIDFIQETNYFSIPVVLNSKEYEEMEIFETEINDIINGFAYRLFLEIKYSNFKIDMTIIDMPTEKIEYDSCKVRVR